MTLARGMATLLALAIPALSSCGGEEPFSRRESADIGFVDRTAEAGIRFVNHTGVFRDKPRVVDAKGGGVLSLDYDGDGDLDLYFLDGNSYHLDVEGRLVTRRRNPDAGNMLYRNDGGWRFTDVTEEAGAGDPSYGIGGTVGDFDGDGDPDIFLCNWGRNVLLRNEGDGTFRDVTRAAGVAGDSRLYSTCAAFFDADGDSDLDLYVANYCDLHEAMAARRGEPAGRRIGGIWRYAGPRTFRAQADIFYRNLGGGRFADETVVSLVQQLPSYGFQPVPFDADNDGDLDLYVANDSVPNFLWVNDGSGCFHDRAPMANLAVSEAAIAQAGMGVTAGDFDQDGWMDVLVSNFASDWNTLYRNRSGEEGLRFEEVSHSRGLGLCTFDRVSWGVALRDFDHDGWLDVFVSNGHVYPTPSPETVFEGGTYEQTMCLLLGMGPPDWSFTDASREAGPGMRIPRLGRGSAFADLDDDGDIDVCVGCLNQPPLLLENRLPKRGHWFQLRLVGKQSNRDAIGARATVVAGGGRIRQMVDHSLAASFASSQDPRIHWGLGDAESVDRLTVRWPSGRVQVFEDLAADRCWRLEEGDEAPVRDR